MNYQWFEIGFFRDYSFETSPSAKNSILCISFEIVSTFQVKCLFLDGDNWSDKNMSVGSVNEDSITCLTNHLSSFTMVILPRTGKVDRRLYDLKTTSCFTFFSLQYDCLIQVSTSSKKAMQIIYYIGTGLSLTGLIFSCLIYVVLQ